MEFNSIKDFKSNFTKIYHSDVAPKLRVFDAERLSTRKKAITFSVISLLLGVFIFLFFNSTPNDIFLFVSGVFIFFGLFIYPLMQKGFEHKLKVRILPVLMKAFGNFQWSNQDAIDTSEASSHDYFQVLSIEILTTILSELITTCLLQFLNPKCITIQEAPGAGVRNI